jgi:hypothetical protein
MGTLERRVESNVYLRILRAEAEEGETDGRRNNENRASRRTEESGDQERVRTDMA